MHPFGVNLARLSFSVRMCISNEDLAYAQFIADMNVFKFFEEPEVDEIESKKQLHRDEHSTSVTASVSGRKFNSFHMLLKSISANHFFVAGVVRLY